MGVSFFFFRFVAAGWSGTGKGRPGVSGANRVSGPAPWGSLRRSGLLCEEAKAEFACGLFGPAFSFEILGVAVSLGGLMAWSRRV